MSRLALQPALVVGLGLGLAVWLSWLVLPAAQQEPTAQLPLGVQRLRQALRLHRVANAVANVPDSKGTDFWLTFPDNLSVVAPILLITSDQETTGTVTIAALEFTSPFSVSAGTVTTVPLPLMATLQTSDTVENKGIHITAASEVSVYGLHQFPFTTDAYLALPTDILGTEYIVLGYQNADVVNGTQFAIAATTDATTVTVTPSVTTDTHPAGVPYSFTMNQGQTYFLRNTGTAPNDLSGTMISSNLPIAVFGGHQCANIPPNVDFCDYIVEQLPPLVTWGKNFVTMPLATRLNGDTFRLLASTDSTTVSVNGAAVATLNRGQLHEQTIAEPAHISADQPILVAQYSNGTGFDGVTSDPFMMVIPPFEQFLDNYTVSTPASGFPVNFLNVVAPSAAVGTILLDGTAIPADNFVPIGTSGFAGAQVSINAGSHTLTAALPFGVFVYGFAFAESYGYPGGMSLAPVVIATTVVLTPETAANPVGTEHCVMATVTDQGGSPVAGVRVDFTVTGVHPTADFASTDENGQAAFCYPGANLGADTIVAAVGTVADSATTMWVAAIMQFGDGLSSLTVDVGQGTYSLAYVVDGASQRCSGRRASVDAGLLMISSRCLEDVRDLLRAIGPTDGSVTVQLLDRTGPSATNRTVRRFLLRPQ